MFKIMKARFEVFSEYYGYHYLFEITRQQSGANKYGDQSAHILDIFDMNKDKAHIDWKLYDTRYDSIPTDKNEWVKVWETYIKENWAKVSTIKMLSYEEDFEEYK